MFDRYVITPIIALGLAFLIWVYVRSRDQDVQNYFMPVEVAIDPQQADRYVFEGKSELKMRVKFFGLPRQLRQVKESVDQDDLGFARSCTCRSRSTRGWTTNIAKRCSSMPPSSWPRCRRAFMRRSPRRGPGAGHSEAAHREVSALKPNVTPSSSQYELEGPVRLEPANVKVTGSKSVLDAQSQLVLEPGSRRCPAPSIPRRITPLN